MRGIERGILKRKLIERRGESGRTGKDPHMTLCSRHHRRESRKREREREREDWWFKNERPVKKELIFHWVVAKDIAI